MSEPIKCGCGGEAKAFMTDFNFTWFVACPKCKTMAFGNTEEEAIEIWNRAMGKQIAIVKSFGHPCGVYGYCSNCGGYCVNEEPYCPHCGAKVEWE